MIGIYKITNLKNNKCYIGQSKSIEDRKNKHLTLLRNNKHNNQHLQNAWNKYLEESFIFEIIEELSYDKIDLLNEREKYWIDYYNSFDNNFGYNNTLGGDGIKGYTHSDEAKKKISESSKGRTLTEEHKQKLINSITGRKKSKEELEKLSNAAKGRKISEWHKKQLIEGRKNYKMTDEVKQKISNSRKGFKMSEEQKKKLSEINKGKTPGNKKLTKFQEEQIVETFLTNNEITINDLAIKYSVSGSTIRNTLYKFNAKREKKSLKNKNKEPNDSKQITEEQVKQIVELLLQNKTNKEIQKITNISYNTILNIRNKKSYSNLTKNIEIPKIKDEQLKLEEDQATEIIELLLKGQPIRSIAKQYNVSPTTIRNIKIKKTWTHLTKNIQF